MRAAACGIVHANHDLTGEHVLHAQVPLVDFRVASRRGIQTVVILKPVEGQRPSRLSLGKGKTRREGIGERRKLRLKIIPGKWNRVGVAESRADKLKICRYIQAIVDSSPTPDHRFRVHRVSKTHAWGPIVAVYREIAVAGACKNSGAEEIARSVQRVRHTEIG